MHSILCVVKVLCYQYYSPSPSPLISFGSGFCFHWGDQFLDADLNIFMINFAKKNVIKIMGLRLAVIFLKFYSNAIQQKYFHGNKVDFF